MKYRETKVYSILNSKCPRCHEGDFFETKNPYNLKKFDKMHTNCPTCGEDFERETGYYYGAMYVSYGIAVGFGLTVFAIISILLGYDEITFLITFACLQVLMMPIFYRTARLIWINMFVDYKALKKG